MPPFDEHSHGMSPADTPIRKGFDWCSIYDLLRIDCRAADAGDEELGLFASQLMDRVLSRRLTSASAIRHHVMEAQYWFDRAALDRNWA